MLIQADHKPICAAGISLDQPVSACDQHVISLYQPYQPWISLHQPVSAS
jgi:hypothetical protein